MNQFPNQGMNNAFQQRLHAMEQNSYNPYNMYPSYSAPQVQSQQQVPVIKARAVTGIDEVKAMLIDLDGSINVFVDVSKNKIYTKRVQNDGSSLVQTYSLDETPEAVAPTAAVTREEFEELKCQLLKLSESIEGGNSDGLITSNANDGSTKK